MEANTPSDPKGDSAETDSMEKLLAGEQLEGKLPRRGEIREGTIVSVSSTEILVDIGAKSEGIISQNEVSRMSDEARNELRVGSTLSLFVLGDPSQGAPIQLSLQEAEKKQQWQQAEEQLMARGVLTGSILEFNRGGVVVKVGELRGFLPASLMSLERQRRNTGSTPEERWKDMVGEELTFKIREVDEDQNRLILSERAAEKEVRAAQRAELLGRIKPGQTHSGRVVSLANFGAFVDIGGIDGLVHVSQLSWTHIDHPSEALEVGQDIDVQVLSVDCERQRVGLSLKALQEDPWDNLTDSYKEGQLVRATIIRLTKFGAFAALKDSDRIQGLVHISELADGGISHPKEVVKENEELTLRIMKIDAEQHRLGLSLKEVASPRFAELDYAFYVASEEDATSDEEQAPVDAAGASNPLKDLDDGPTSAASGSADAPQPLPEVVESSEIVGTIEDYDTQKPPQLAAGATE